MFFPLHKRSLVLEYKKMSRITTKNYFLTITLFIGIINQRVSTSPCYSDVTTVWKNPLCLHGIRFNELNINFTSRIVDMDGSQVNYMDDERPTQSRKTIFNVLLINFSNTHSAIKNFGTEFSYVSYVALVNGQCRDYVI